MFVAVPDWILKRVPVEPFASLRMLGVDQVDLGLDRQLVTPSFIDHDGRAFDLSSAKGQGALKNRLAEHRCRVCCLSLGTDFGREDQEAEAQWIVRACQTAEELEVPVIRIDPAAWSAKLEDEELLRRITGAVGRALDESEGVAIAAENHGPVANRSEFVDRMLDGIGSERFGLTLDAGNFYWFGYPLDRVYELVERYAARVRHTHFKNIAYPEGMRQQQREIGWRYGELSCPLPDGDIDHKRTIAALEEAGYRGALAVEDESVAGMSPEQATNALQRDVEYLKTILR